MLLLPLTPPLIYLKLKKIKGPKMDSLFSLHFTFTFTFTFTIKEEEVASRPPLLWANAAGGIALRSESRPAGWFALRSASRPS